VVTRRVKTGGAYVGAGGLGAPSPPQWQNTYEDQEFTGAYVADPGGGPDQWQYSGGSGVAYYVDPSFGAGGDGSYASPWDDFTEINALTGDLGGRSIRLKSGETIYDELDLTGASNFTIETYGGSPLAIIDGSVLTNWTWTNEAGTNLWYTSTPGAAKAVWLGDSNFEAAGSHAAFVQEVLDRCEMTWWYGTHSTYGHGAVLWVHAPQGVSMTDEEAADNVRTTGADTAIHLTGCSAVTLSGVQAQRGRIAVVKGYDHGAGFTITGCVLRQCGYATAAGQDLLDVRGVSKAVKATNIFITNNQFLDNMCGLGANHGIEVSYTDGMVVLGNTFRRMRGNGMELWLTTHTTTVEKNLFEDIGQTSVLLADGVGDVLLAGDGGVYHSGVVVKNNLSVAFGNLTNSASNAGSRLVWSKAGSDVKVYNNTSVTSAQYNISVSDPALTPVGLTNTLTAKNNVFLKTNGTGFNTNISASGSGWSVVNTISGSKQILCDGNHYLSLAYTEPNQPIAVVNGTTYSGLTAWKATNGDPNGYAYNLSLASAFGTPSGTTTTTTNNRVANDTTVGVASVSGFSVGDWVTIGTDTARVFVNRITQINALTLTLEIPFASFNTSTYPKTVTRLTSLVGDLSPTTTPPLNSGIGSATDANVPTVDFYGNARSTTAPDIGAVEV
jgi:hypothetical protein